MSVWFIIVSPLLKGPAKLAYETPTYIEQHDFPIPIFNAKHQAGRQSVTII
jgi:hypothetical protein